jgi:quinol monooxygenase YgiN
MTTIHTFFNVITFPEDKVDEAFAAWQAIGEYMEKQEGFLGSMLYRNRRNPLMLINHGRYTTEEAFLASVQNQEFQALSQKLTDLGVERAAGLYDEVQSFGQEDV